VVIVVTIANVEEAGFCKQRTRLMVSSLNGTPNPSVPAVTAFQPITLPACKSAQNQSVPTGGFQLFHAI